MVAYVTYATFSYQINMVSDRTIWLHCIDAVNMVPLQHCFTGFTISLKHTFRVIQCFFVFLGFLCSHICAWPIENARQTEFQHLFIFCMWKIRLANDEFIFGYNFVLKICTAGYVRKWTCIQQPTHVYDGFLHSVETLICIIIFTVLRKGITMLYGDCNVYRKLVARHTY